MLNDLWLKEILEGTKQKSKSVMKSDNLTGIHGMPLM
jgi:hypothetical protein